MTNLEKWAEDKYVISNSDSHNVKITKYAHRESFKAGYKFSLEKFKEKIVKTHHEPTIKILECLYEVMKNEMNEKFVKVIKED
jgi:hypothetical protein